MRTHFNAATERDKKAAEYFSSNEFFELMRDTAESIVSSSERDKKTDYALLPDFPVEQQDMPHVQKAFEKLQQKYPQLDHVRRNKGLGAAFGRRIALRSGASGEVLILDTQKNTLPRRIKAGISTRKANVPDDGGIKLAMYYGS